MDLSTNRKALTASQKKALQYIVQHYGGRKIELDYETPFQLLCAVILSAQSTDKQVNRITPAFFAKVRDSKDVLHLSQEEVENDLKYVNYFRNKSRFIREAGEILTKEYGGIIPNDLTLLQTLPGVGVKTAKVVLSVLYDAPYIGVDTHIHRVMNRIGIVDTHTPNQTDRELEYLIPLSLKRVIHHPVVLFGRYHCTAKRPKCANCHIAKYCNYAKNHSTPQK